MFFTLFLEFRTSKIKYLSIYFCFIESRNFNPILSGFNLNCVIHFYECLHLLSLKSGFPIYPKISIPLTVLISFSHFATTFPHNWISSSPVTFYIAGILSLYQKYNSPITFYILVIYRPKTLISLKSNIKIALFKYFLIKYNFKSIIFHITSLKKIVYCIYK